VHEKRARRPAHQFVLALLTRRLGVRDLAGESHHVTAHEVGLTSHGGTHHSVVISIVAFVRSLPRARR